MPAKNRDNVAALPHANARCFARSASVLLVRGHAQLAVYPKDSRSADTVFPKILT
jgi:hypothetical protein